MKHPNYMQQEAMGIGHQIGGIKMHIEDLGKKVKVKVESQKIAPSHRVHKFSSGGEYTVPRCQVIIFHLPKYQ